MLKYSFYLKVHILLGILSKHSIPLLIIKSGILKKSQSEFDYYDFADDF